LNRRSGFVPPNKHFVVPQQHFTPILFLP